MYKLHYNYYNYNYFNVTYNYSLLYIVSKDLEGTVDLSSSITYCGLLTLIARSSNIYCQPCAASTYRFLYCLLPSAVYCAPFPNTYCSFFLHLLPTLCCLHTRGATYRLLYCLSPSDIYCLSPSESDIYCF